MSEILFTKDNGIGRIALNRPDAFNSVNKAMGVLWLKALDECKKDDEIRVVVITGSGKAFCAGQDLKEVTDPSLNPGFRVLLEEKFGPIVRKIVELEKPIIAAVNGVAAGAGANLALCCDIVVASQKASFIQAFSAIGLMPDSAGTFFLPRLIGRSRAMAYAMLGDKISASEAERIGMIYKSIEVELFEEEVNKLANRMSVMATHGLALTKRAINASMHNDFYQQLALETELQIEAANTADYREGVAAFVEKRKPNFQGK